MRATEHGDCSLQRIPAPPESPLSRSQLIATADCTPPRSASTALGPRVAPQSGIETTVSAKCGVPSGTAPGNLRHESGRHNRLMQPDRAYLAASWWRRDL